MNTELDPIVGHWYRQVDKDLVFRVVAFDEEGEIVEIQHADGELEEMDASAWFDMEIEATEAPEDWDDGLEDIDDDDDVVSPLTDTDWDETADAAEPDEDDEPPEDDDEDSSERDYGSE